MWWNVFKVYNKLRAAGQLRSVKPINVKQIQSEPVPTAIHSRMSVVVDFLSCHKYDSFALPLRCS